MAHISHLEKWSNNVFLIGMKRKEKTENKVRKTTVFLNTVILKDQITVSQRHCHDFPRVNRNMAYHMMSLERTDNDTFRCFSLF